MEMTTEFSCSIDDVDRLNYEFYPLAVGLKKAEVIDGLSRSMGRYKVNQYLSAKYDDVINGSTDVVVGRGFAGDICSLISASWIEADAKCILYLCTALIGERHQRNGTLKQMLAVLFKHNIHHFVDLPFYISVRTYNPNSFAALKCFHSLESAKFFPNYDGSPKERTLSQNEVEWIKNRLYPSEAINYQTGVIKNGAGKVVSDFYPEFPSCRSEKINRFFLENLTSMDRLLCILKLEKPECRKRFLKKFIGEELVKNWCKKYDQIAS